MTGIYTRTDRIGHDQKKGHRVLLLEEDGQEGYDLHGLAQAHLIGEHDIAVAWPGAIARMEERSGHAPLGPPLVKEPANAFDLERLELTAGDVVGLFGEGSELGGRSRFVESGNIGLRHLRQIDTSSSHPGSIGLFEVLVVVIAKLRRDVPGC